MYGRLVFGASAVLLGVVSIVWRGSDMWQHLAAIPSAERTVVAWCLALAQIAGGIGVLQARTARTGAVMLGVVYVVFSLQIIPDIAAAPAAYGRYGNFFDVFSLVCGALAVYAVTQRRARALRLGAAARIGFGVCALSFAAAQVAYLQYTASLVPTWIPLGGVFWTNVTTAAFALAGIALLLDRFAGLASWLLGLMVVLFGIIVWLPRLVAHSSGLGDWSEFAETFLVAGAAWAVAEARAPNRTR